jgi:uncharacterized membrane protein
MAGEAHHQAFNGRTAAIAAATALLVAGLVGYAQSRRHRTGRRRDDTRRALGGSRGIRFEESITIAATPEDLYDRWRKLSDLPRFIPHLESVEVIDDRRSRWTARGPANVRVSWDAEIINEIHPHVIAWRSLPGADVASAGSVRFVKRPRGGTTVTVMLQYEPPAGKLGGWMAWLGGASPERELRKGLRALKQIVEAGETPTTEGQPSGLRSRRFRWIGAAS